MHPEMPHGRGIKEKMVGRVGGRQNRNAGRWRQSRQRLRVAGRGGR